MIKSSFLGWEFTSRPISSVLLPFSLGCSPSLPFVSWSVSDSCIFVFQAGIAKAEMFWNNNQISLFFFCRNKFTLWGIFIIFGLNDIYIFFFTKPIYNWIAILNFDGKKKENLNETCWILIVYVHTCSSVWLNAFNINYLHYVHE